MPELPETETMARVLDHEIAGHSIREVRVHRADVLREIGQRAFASRLKRATIRRCWRRAKLVVIDLSDDRFLVVQPRFTGALLIDRGDLADDERRFSTIELHLDGDLVLHYRDIRRLGTVTLMSADRWSEYQQRLGPEPLDRLFTDSYLSALLRASSQPVKKVLMDQRRIAGIGNIYANEALWRAGIDPSRAAKRISPNEAGALHAALRDVLAEAIAARGTTFRDFRDPSGSQGGFATRLAAYGRGGMPCGRCGARLVETHAIDGRSSVLCVHCQR
jgi:formamidopyrimidine-DNA glycosylase